MPLGLHDLTTPTPDGNGTFTLDVPDGWQQGRGAFGGLVLGSLARASMMSEPDGSRTLRSLTGELPGAVPVGRSTITVETLRRGSGASTLHARLVHEGEVFAAATAVLGKTRVADDGVPVAGKEPKGPPWQAVTPIPIGPPMGPAFALHYEFRPTGPMPFAGGNVAVCEGYVRPRVRPKKLSVTDLVAMVDAYWPAIFSVTNAPRPMGTIGFAFQVLVDPETLDPEVPLFHRGTQLGASEGFVAELRELYTFEGTKVAVNLQTLAIIR